jgi:UDP-GlcNAc3NAcA epimerase
VTVIDPVGYFDMIELLKGANMVLTDSGGLQKEAFFFSNPCVTLRDETEWTELVEGGYNVLAGADASKICQAFQRMKTIPRDFSANLYGEGHASELIVNNLVSR